MTQQHNTLIKKLKSALKLANKNRIKTAIQKVAKSKPLPECFFEAAYYLLRDGHGYESDALKFFRKGIRLKPEYAEKVVDLIKEPFMADNDQTCEMFLEAALDVAPDNNFIAFEYALLSVRLEKFEQAEAVYTQLLERNGPHHDVLVNMSDLYLKMNRNHDAVACAQLAIESRPNAAVGYYNLGVILMSLARYKEAIAYFEKAIELNPEHIDVRLCLGQLQLKAGQLTAGWKNFEYRWSDTQPTTKLDLPLPLWRGELLQDKGILVWGDQGLGDSIMFSGFINRLIQMGARVSVICIRRLEHLFTRSFDLETYYAHGDNDQLEISGNYQYQIPLGSLPGHFVHSFNDFGDGSAYLFADKQQILDYKMQLTEKFPDKKLIGFTWRGGISHTRKFVRDTGLEIWRPLFANPDYQFINLQYDSLKENNQLIEQMGGYNPDLDCKNDIDGLAAIMGALDLVISADNSTVHLAGALGVPVWTLLPYCSEWRWFFEEEKTYWYNSMRLFHQQKLNDWQECFNQVEKALPEMFKQP